MSGLFSTAEVAKHNNYESLWVIINNNVYDLTKFANVHPAGRNVLKDYAGQDVTRLYKQFHSETIMYKYHEKLCIGKLSDPKPKEDVPMLAFKGSMGDGIPYGDANSVQGMMSPYYKDYHFKLREAVRQFLYKEIIPYLDQWDTEKKFPRELINKVGEAGLYGLLMGKWPKEYLGGLKLFGLDIPNPDIFCELVATEEFAKYTSIGVMWYVGQVGIGLPPIYQHGSEYLKNKYVKDVLLGKTLNCLAVTEPWAGSDVAGIKTTAKKTECGKYYIVNGMKKFITTGAFADVFTTAVRTGEEDSGYFGVSLLAIEKTYPGVKQRQMNMGGVWGSGTGFITFENVKVPVEQLIGEEGYGFMYAMQNFNHERFQIIIQTTASARQVLEECMKYAHIRETFGKKLIDQPVIRQKLAHMIRVIESQWAYLELIAYNFDKMDKKQEKVIAAAISIAKAQSNLILEDVSREAVQILGGNGYQRGSVGSRVERIYREAKSITLGGGTPEIMFDMAIRQASKLMPKPKM